MERCTVQFSKSDIDRGDHTSKIKHIPQKLDLGKFSFLSVTIKDWNKFSTDLFVRVLFRLAVLPDILKGYQVKWNEGRRIKIITRFLILNFISVICSTFYVNLRLNLYCVSRGYSSFNCFYTYAFYVILCDYLLWWPLVPQLIQVNAFPRDGWTSCKIIYNDHVAANDIHIENNYFHQVFTDKFGNFLRPSNMCDWFSCSM